MSPLRSVPSVCCILLLFSLGVSRAQEPVYPEGKRFPLGVYSVDLKDPVAKHGWNIGQSYGFRQDKQGFIARARDAGLLSLGLSETIKLEMPEAEIARLIAECTPAESIAWWDIPEEVKWYEPAKFAALQERCAWVRKHDSLRHPLFMYLAGDFGIEDVQHYVPLVDVVSASCYSNFKNRPRAFNRWILESRIAAIKQAGYRIGPDYRNGEKTVCAVLELFDFTDSGDRLSFPHHAYHDFWSAIASGAQGILVYSHARQKTNPRLPAYWEQYCLAASRLTGPERLDQVVLFGTEAISVTARVANGPARTPAFKPRINALSPTPPPDIEIDYPSINVLAKTWNGNLYLVAVNSAIGKITAEINALPPNVTKATVLFEDREVAVYNGVIQDDFSDHGVHIYKMPAETSAPAPGKPGPITFEDVTAATGLDELLKGVNGHAAAWGDINNDGYLDLFVGTFANHTPAEYNYRGHGPFPEPDKLLVNQKGERFILVTPSPTEITGRVGGAAFADFDNDGHMDLVSSHLSNPHTNPVMLQSNHLYRNDGTSKMIDVTDRSNLVFNVGSQLNSKPCSARNTFVLDYDGDGLIDLLMQDDDVWPWSIGRSHLMRNKGGMVFEDVTAKAGLPESFSGLGGWVGDINGDDWSDIFFAQSSVMYINNRDGTFHKLQREFVDSPTNLPVRTGNEIWTCGAEIGDLNGDGRLDFVMGDHYQNPKDREHRIHVFINRGNDANGDPIFEDVSGKCGIKVANSKQPHIALEDFNNDGKTDILVSNAESFIYTNIGTDTDGVPHFTGPLGSHAPGIGLPYWPGGPVADYDRDGRLDFFGPQWYAYVHSPLLRNVTAGAEDYITIAVALPAEKNRNAIGAMVSIYKPGQLGQADALLGIKCISVANGYSSGSPAEAHFGTPGYDKVDILVKMPCGGNIYRVPSVPTRQFYTVTGNSGQPAGKAARP